VQYRLEKSIYLNENSDVSAMELLRKKFALDSHKYKPAVLPGTSFTAPKDTPLEQSLYEQPRNHLL
jgi:hypothetical protein